MGLGDGVNENGRQERGWEDGRALGINRRDGQRLVVESLLLPGTLAECSGSGTETSVSTYATYLMAGASAVVGALLGQIPWVRNRIPDTFHRNILGGCLCVVMKDIVGAIYGRHQRSRRRTRKVTNYAGPR